MTRGTRVLPSVPRYLVSVVLTVVLFGTVASAQVCRSEFDAALAGSADPSVVTGLDAARALERAVTLAEPALPPLVRIDRLPIATNHPEAETVRYLAERRLLPAGWAPDHLAPAVWHEMLRRFLDWYALAPPPMRPSAPSDDAAMAGELAHVLEGIAGAVRPAALFATDPDDRSRLAFRAVIWNWSVYPRLLVFRSDGEDAVAGATAAAVSSLENCVRSIRHWFSAPEPTARQLFLANQRARMVVVGAQPMDGEVTADGPWPWFVPEGDELAVFDFAHPRVSGLEAYAVVFAGPSVGVAGLVRLLPSVRTNVSPLGLRSYLQTPP